MWSFSRAKVSSAETKPPSWPAAASSGSVARASTMSRLWPKTSSSVRSRPKRFSSISVSHIRNLGQARVHIVQPFSPWVHESIEPSMSRWKGL